MWYIRSGSLSYPGAARTSRRRSHVARAVREFIMSNVGDLRPDPSIVGTIAKPLQVAGFRRGAINPFLLGY